MTGSNVKGIKRYEDILKQIMNVEELHYLKGKEWEGCLGVACILAYLEGVPSSPQAMSKHLHISPFNSYLKTAFDRLKVNGVFGPRYDAKNDELLKGEITDFSHPYFTPQHMSEVAWCHVAGVAGGFCGMKEKNKEENKDL